jgi:hypothetical protein
VALGASPPSAVLASPFHSQSIGTDTTWSTDQVLTTDVVVENGATLTIAEGVDVMVDVTTPETSPSPFGLSEKVEIIVKSGGVLEVKQGVKLHANADRGWYGVVFRPNSFGTITGAHLSRGTVGVTVQSASVTVQDNTIENMRGGYSLTPGSDGELGAGILITGTSTAYIISNTITDIYGGPGEDGAAGAPGVFSAAGGDGGDGGRGGRAYGIIFEGAGTPVFTSNTITKVWGGDGGVGGAGGAGGRGSQLFPDAGSGGRGGFGEEGGDAYGIYASNTGDKSYIQVNTISHIFAGNGGDGGAGGVGGAGDQKGDGGAGGDGGTGGDGGDGGQVTGIRILADEIVLGSNLISSTLASGSGGLGGDGGAGGAGGPGASGTDFSPGGSGGAGGSGGYGGGGGQGGPAYGIQLEAFQAPRKGSSEPAVLVWSNSIIGRVSAVGAGAGGVGGPGGSGGAGGAGRLTISGYTSNGGAGGDGGRGGNGGSGGENRPAVGMEFVLTTPGVVARNQVGWTQGAIKPGGGGVGGEGGEGSAGGAGLVGGDGGDGGDGGGGGSGKDGGEAVGVRIMETVGFENNLVHHTYGGDGSDGGNGGNGGAGGAAGTGGTTGSAGAGGEGGAGGWGADAAGGFGLVADTTTKVEVVNNTIAEVSAGDELGSGGTGGSGGADGDGAGAGSNGDEGTDGSEEDAYGFYLKYGDATLVNNIIAFTHVSHHISAVAASSRIGVMVDTANPTNLTLDYNDVYGWDKNYEGTSPGNNDISDDPRFVNPYSDNYHLLSDSPCIDTGTSTYTGLTLPDDDLYGNARPYGSSHDIGAEEYTPPPCTPLDTVTISGPTVGVVGTEHTFSAVISPANASTPISYTWAPAPSSGQGTATVKYIWTTAGTKDIQINVSNCNGGGVATYKHTITINPAISKIYLPLIMHTPEKK